MAQAPGPSPAERRVGQFALALWAILAASAVLFVGFGGIWLIRRLGRGPARRGRRVRRRYLGGGVFGPQAKPAGDQREHAEGDE